MNKIKVAQVSARSSRGGAAVQVRQLNKLLTERVKFDSKLIVSSGDDCNESDIIVLRDKYISPKLGISWILGKIGIFRNQIKHSVNIFGNSRILKELHVGGYEIVHLHWIANETMSMKQLSSLSQPLVVTLHDSWFFCGAEHHPEFGFFEGYRDGYAEKGAYTSLGLLVNRFQWERKFLAIHERKITFIAPSQFMKTLILESKIFNPSCHSVEVIGHGVDTEFFYPMSASRISELKIRFNIRSDRISILLAGVDIVSDVNKGFSTLSALLGSVDPRCREKFEFFVVGSEHGPSQIAGFQFSYFGEVPFSEMPTVYNLVDITLVLSKIESFCLVAAESIASGTPVISIGDSAVTDFIVPGCTGYLIDPLSIGCFENIVHSAFTIDRFECRNYALQNLIVLDSVIAHEKIYSEVLGSDTDF